MFHLNSSRFNVGGICFCVLLPEKNKRVFRTRSTLLGHMWFLKDDIQSGGKKMPSWHLYKLLSLYFHYFLYKDILGNGCASRKKKPAEQESTVELSLSRQGNSWAPNKTQSLPPELSQTAGEPGGTACWILPSAWLITKAVRTMTMK